MTLFCEIPTAQLIRDGIPPVTWDLEPMLARRTLTCLSGSAKSYKTWIALDMVICLVSGQSFAGQAASGDHRVLFLEAENPLHVVPRFAALCKGRGLDPFELLERIRFISPDRLLMQLNRPEQASELIRLASDYRATWVVLDSLRRLHLLNENDSDQMAAFANTAMLPLRDQAGCGVLALDHTPIEERGRIRGSGDKLASLDQHINVLKRKSGGRPCAVLRVKDSRVMEESDHRYGLQLVQTDNGGLRLACLNALKPGRPAEKLEAAAAAIKHLLCRYPDASQAQAVKVACQRSGCSEATAKRAWTEQVKSPKGSLGVHEPRPEGSNGRGAIKAPLMNPDDSETELEALSDFDFEEIPEGVTLRVPGWRHRRREDD